MHRTIPRSGLGTATRWCAVLSAAALLGSCSSSVQSPDVSVTTLMPQVVCGSQFTTKLTVSGIDRQKVGQVAADMRSLRPPDPYKQKGVRYVGEKLKKKVGKTGAK